MIRIKTQLSVVIENRPGVLTRICDKLASHQINIEGFSAYGEREHGIIRLVTGDPERAAEILTDSGFLVTRTEIVSAKLTNRPAGLLRLARRLADHRINIEYAYGSAATAGRMATIYMRVANPQRACELLSGPPAAARRRDGAPRGATAERGARQGSGGHGDKAGKEQRKEKRKGRGARDRRTVRAPRGRR